MGRNTAGEVCHVRAPGARPGLLSSPRGEAAQSHVEVRELPLAVRSVVGGMGGCRGRTIQEVTPQRLGLGGAESCCDLMVRITRQGPVA